MKKTKKTSLFFSDKFICMNTQQLFSKFSSALLWNGLFYTIYKLFSIFLTFTLFQNLNPQDFSVWASTNSLIFITILFLDCGFRKSIPRFSTIFSKNQQAHKKFISTLIFFELSLLLFVGLPIIKLVVSFFMNAQTFTLLTPYIMILFVAEGLVALFRLVFHAHFWQKEFNTLHTLVFLIETVCNLYLLFSTSFQANSIPTLLTNKIIACSVVIIGSFLMLPSLYGTRSSRYAKNNAFENNLFDYAQTFKQFIKHSAIMWGSTLIKAVTERNILFPYFTITLGAPVANLFKIVHDSGLFFQRIALKTIGISDTALLAHAQENKTEKTQFNLAFKELIKKVFYVCVPLFIIGIITAHYNITLNQNYTTYSLFLIVTIGYLVEIILSPFERVLETQKEYKKLWFSYTPYLIGITFLFFYNWLCAPLSLIVIMLIIHLLRLIGSLLMVFFVQKKSPI